MTDQPLEVVQPRQMQVQQPLGVNEIIAQVNLIQQVMQKVMQEGEHYGAIPGCGDKKTLLQPGAQKLTMTFRLAPEYVIQETDLANHHKEYRVVCTLKSIGNGNPVGQGVGCCSTMESKYRWRAGARKCPKCGAESIIKGKAEYGGGWICFAKKGGCGEKWAEGTEQGNIFQDTDISKVENDNPADCYNTVLKIAKKRAFVDATITATAASDIFTQDIGDAEELEPTPKAYVKTEPHGDFDSGDAGMPASRPEPTQQQSAPKSQPRPKEQASSGPLQRADVTLDSVKPWTSKQGTKFLFCKFITDSGADLEAGTKDPDMSAFLNESIGGALEITYRPGFKEGTWELCTAAPADNIP